MKIGSQQLREEGWRKKWLWIRFEKEACLVIINYLERRVVWMERCEDWWWLSGSLWEHVISPIWSLSLIWPPWQFDSWLRWELFLILTAEPRAAPGSIWEALEKLNKEFVVFVFLCSLSSLLNCPSHWKVSWKETPPDITICINRRHTNWAAFVKTFFTLLESTYLCNQAASVTNCTALRWWCVDMLHCVEM